MRWIFLTLLMANIAYFAHGWYEKGFLPPAQFEVLAPAIKKGARIHLLSEVNGIKAEATDLPVLQDEPQGSARSTPVEADDAAEQPVMLSVCTSVGPFNAVVTAENLRQRLLVLGVASRVDKVKLTKAPDYWIYLPPFKGRGDALSELRRLHKAGLDSYVIGEGELANGVSLGLFSSQASARKVRGEAEALGYEAKIKIVERFDHRYWVELEPGLQQELSEQVWQSLGDRFAFAERRERVCGNRDLAADRPATELE